MARYTLNDLESLTGIKSDTIRIWELRYKILKPNRTSTKRKWYTDTDLAKLLNIDILHNNGLKISKIAGMTDRELRERAFSIAERIQGPGEEIALMIMAMNRFDEQFVNDIIIRSVLNKGFEDTFTDLVFPFLNKVGILWHTGSVDPGTEHFITAHFRKWLISAIDGIRQEINENRKRFLLFLPEGEWHELGLLFYYWFLLKNGHKALYLGQSTPAESVFAVARSWKPDSVITGIMTGSPGDKPEKYLSILGKELAGVKIYAAGILADVADKLQLPGIIPLKGISDLDFLRLKDQ
jgi:MerR family transcriptional regulator, light-induced transcriptional regulator